MKAFVVGGLIFFSQFAVAAQRCPPFLGAKAGDSIRYNGKKLILEREIARYGERQWFSIAGDSDRIVRIAAPKSQRLYLETEPLRFENRARILEHNDDYVFVKALPGPILFDRVMKILEDNHKIRFFTVESGRPLNEQIATAVNRKIEMSPKDIPIGAHFTIDEQVVILTLVKFFLKAEEFPFGLKQGWHNQSIWSQGQHDWYLLDWE